MKNVEWRILKMKNEEWRIWSYVLLLREKGKGKGEKGKGKGEKWKIALTQFCLEDSTEQSESHPGRSLGMNKEMIDGCLEDSTKEK